MQIVRRAFVAVLLAGLNACASGSSVPPPPAAPPDFTFLNRLRLDVAEVLVEDRLPPPGPNDRGARARPPVADYLRAVARDRLLAEGTSGRAVASLQDASITEVRLPTQGSLFTTEIDTRYDGRMKLRVDVIGADGTPEGFTEAQVTRSQTVLENVDEAGRARIVQDMAKQLADAMNVELEFQARRGLGQALLTGPRAPPVGEVQQEDLAAPNRRR